MSSKWKSRVRAYWQYPLAVAASLACGLALAAPASASAAPPAVEICGLGPAVVKPASMILTCADGRMAARQVHWQSWTTTQANATATVIWQASPTRRDHTTADLTLSGPILQTSGKILFTTLSLRVTGTTPRGFDRHITFSEAPSLPAKATAPAGGRARARAYAASGTLNTAAIGGFWELAGGPSSVAETAEAITGAESSFDPGIIQAGQPYSTTGWGLWQITPGDSIPGTYGQDFQLLDPWNNAEGAINKYDAAGGFSPWVTYDDGAYKNYLQYTSPPNTDLTDPGQYIPINSAPSGTHNSSDPGSTYGPPIPTQNHPVAGNLLANGSFENSASGWDRFVPSGVTVNVSHYEVGHGAPAAAHDGSWYLATNTNGAGGAIYQDVTVNASAGASYVGTAWLSAQSGTATGRLCVWGLASPGTSNCASYSVTAGTYSKIQVVYDLPASYSTLRFQLYPTPNGGTTDLDSASLVRNLLANGSFENSASGWDRFIPSGVTVNVSHYEVGHGAPAAAHDGSWYLATNTNGAGGAIYQDLTVNASAGASYLATAWLSAQSGTATGRLCVWGLGSPGTSNCESYSVKAGTYSQIQLVYDLPASYSTLRFQLYPTPNGGTTDLDSASLVNNILTNGSFENSASGWDRFVPSGVTVNVSHYEVGHGAPAAAHDGSWYLATNTNGAGGAIYQDVTVNASAGASYVGTAWLSAQSGTATGRLCVWGLGSPGTSNCASYSVTAGTYSEIQVVYDLPASYSTLRFQLYPTPNGGTTDLDTASLT